MEDSNLIADTPFLLALCVTSTALLDATTARRLVRQTTAQERQSATQARTASAPTVRPTQTAPQGRCAATDSVQSRAIHLHLLLHLLHLPQPQQLQNQQPLTHPVLRSAAQTMIVRTEDAKTENVFHTQPPKTQTQLLMVVTQLQL
jgi:hypothetical protein